MRWSEFIRHACLWPIGFGWLKPDFISKQNDVDIHYWQVGVNKYGWTLHLGRLHMYVGPRHKTIESKWVTDAPK